MKRGGSHRRSRFEVYGHRVPPLTRALGSCRRGNAVTSKQKCKQSKINSIRGNGCCNRSLSQSNQLGVGVTFSLEELFSRVLRDSTPRYVGLSVGWSVPFLLFWRFLGFWAHSSFPNASKSHSKSF